MPQEYNTPDWFTPEYHKTMESALRKLDETFRLSLTTDEVLRYIEDHESDGPRPRRELERAKLIWWGDSFNIGYTALFSAPPHIYRHLFHSASRSAIEVFLRGPSAAEESDLPCALAKSLSVEYSGIERVREIQSSFSEKEKEALVLVLKVLSLRHDECGAIAVAALQSYWLSQP
jgi:hypothetical protein